MPHEPAVALQQAGGIGQGRALEEADVYVRSEYVDVTEGCISQARNGTAVMQELANFVAAVSHDLKPLLRTGSQFAAVGPHPCIDCRIALEGAVETEAVGSPRQSLW